MQNWTGLLIIIENYFELFFVVLAALLLERFIPLSKNSSPLSFFRLLFDRIATKVNSKDPKQSTIAGALSITLLILPFVIIIFLIREFAYYTFIIDILLLWISTQFTNDYKTIKQAKIALEQSKKELAKSLLSTQLLRDAPPLSHLGTIKAGIESLYLRYLYQQVTPTFIFILFGPIAALAYRLIYESSHQWHTKLPKFQYFGKTSFYLAKLSQLPCVLGFNFVFLLLFNAKVFFKEITNKMFWKMFSSLVDFHNQTISLWIVSLVLKKDCSGPTMYQGKKLTRLRFRQLNSQLDDNLTSSDLGSILTKISIFNYILLGGIGLLSVVVLLYEN